MKSLPTQKVFDITLTSAPQEEVLEYVITLLEETSDTCAIFTPNPEIVVYATKHKAYRDILNSAEISLCDGVGLYMAGLILGKPVTERIAGVDFMENLCKRVVRKPITVGFLGGGPDVAEKAAECLTAKYPGLSVVFVSEEWEEGGFDKAKKYHLSRIKYQEEKIRNTKYIIHDTKGIDILFVAFGFPKQEEWIMKHLSKENIRVAMGVGGAFDYLSGDISRAPFLLRAAGLEWLYRLLRQPWRLKRQISLLSFLKLTLQERFSR